MIAEFQVDIAGKLLYFSRARVRLPREPSVQSDEPGVCYVLNNRANALLHPQWDEALIEFSLRERNYGVLRQRDRQKHC